MDRAQEIRIKEVRLWDFLDRLNLEGILISRRSNFAWITGGGDNHIFLASEVGAASLLILPEGKFLIAHTMDGERIMAEEIPDQAVDLRVYHWYEDRAEILGELIGGRRVGSDVSAPGLTSIDQSWYEMVYPLLETEVGRLREVGRLADEAMAATCSAVRPGDTELSISGLLGRAYLERGINEDVILVGSDERLWTYRHCLPTEKPVENLLLVHVAGQKYGLHANVTRMVCFGPVPPEIRERYRAICHVHNAILNRLAPGVRFADLFAAIKAAYAETGFGDEWRGHFQGGPADYEACRPHLLMDSEAEVSVNQAYDWLPSLPGAKTEELSLLSGAGVELLSTGTDWPTLALDADGHRFPDILSRPIFF
jgi:Xaa-Pro dipeptidase